METTDETTTESTNGVPEDEDAQSIADLAGGESDEDEEDILESPPLEGTTGQLSLDVGGDDPDLSTAKLRAVSNEVDGEYKRGELVTFTVMARCGEVHFIDTVDAQGLIVKTERRHIFRIESIRGV